MNTKGTNTSDESTPVDDVRRVRDRLNQEHTGDVRELAEHARATTEQLRGKLDLQPVTMPPTNSRRDGTQG